MKTTEKIKEEYLKENGCSYIYSFNTEEVDVLMQRAFNAALELAAEEAKVEKKLGLQNGAVIGEFHVVSKESILSLKLKD